MAEDTEVPEGEEDDTDAADEPVPRVRCVCGTALASHHALELVKETKNQAVREKMAVRRAAIKAATVTPEVAEAEIKPKRNRGGSRKQEDPFAFMCSPCRRKVLAGQNTDTEDEKRLREIHCIYHPEQAKALAEQRRKARDG